jgi:GNAT superfamily N-acetyltransferase
MRRGDICCTLSVVSLRPGSISQKPATPADVTRAREEKHVVTIRPYQDTDSRAVGRLIADTYGEYNLSFLPQEERGPYLGPFQYARSQEPAHQEEIARTLQASLVFVAEDDNGEIVGVLRGRKDRLQSLFVRGDRHHRGIGRRLVERFEQECISLGGEVIRLASTLYAVPFYQRLGYKKSTGVRRGWSFQGTGFRWQPMKKNIQ